MPSNSGGTSMTIRITKLKTGEYRVSCSGNRVSVTVRTLMLAMDEAEFMCDIYNQPYHDITYCDIPILRIED